MYYFHLSRASFSFISSFYFYVLFDHSIITLQNSPISNNPYYRNQSAYSNPLAKQFQPQSLPNSNSQTYQSYVSINQNLQTPQYQQGQPYPHQQQLQHQLNQQLQQQQLLQQQQSLHQHHLLEVKQEPTSTLHSQDHQLQLHSEHLHSENQLQSRQVQEAGAQESSQPLDQHQAQQHANTSYGINDLFY
jgi:hypothetical protein